MKSLLLIGLAFILILVAVAAVGQVIDLRKRSIIGTSVRVDNLSATTDPAPSDDSSQGYSIGSLWKNNFNPSSPKWWVAHDVTPGFAVWNEIFTSGTFPFGIVGKDEFGNMSVGDLPDLFPACSQITGEPTGLTCDYIGQCFVRTDADIVHVCQNVGAPPLAFSTLPDAVFEVSNGTNSQVADQLTTLQLTALAAPTASGTPPNKIISAKIRDQKGFVRMSPQATDEFTFSLYDIPYTITKVKCECYGTVTTAPTIKVCKGEDRGDDLCATDVLSSLVCGTTEASSTTLNQNSFAAGEKLTLLITNTPSADISSCEFQFVTER